MIAEQVAQGLKREGRLTDQMVETQQLSHAPSGERSKRWDDRPKDQRLSVQVLDNEGNGHFCPS